MLNGVVTEEEICTSLENLKKGKAAGPDGLVAEMSLSSSHIVVPYLLKLFNCIFSAGIFPELWSKAVIIPMYKKGTQMMQITTEAYVSQVCLAKYLLVF